MLLVSVMLFISAANSQTLKKLTQANTTQKARCLFEFEGSGNLILENVTLQNTFWNCVNLVSLPELNTSRVSYMLSMVAQCNNLSNASIQNVVNMCLNSNITDINYKNLSNTNTYSPLYNTKFDNTYYQNRWEELSNAGWTY